MISTNVLIVQNDKTEAPCLAERLRDVGYTVCTTVSSARQAVEEAAGACPDVVLIDLELEGESRGIEVAEQLGDRFDVPVVYMTSDTGENLLQQAEATQPYGYVLKPVEARQLHLSIKTALSLHEKEMRRRERGKEAEVRQTVSELRDQTQLMETVFESMDAGVVVLDPEGRLLLSNSRSVEIMGAGLGEERTDEWSSLHGAFYLDRQTVIPGNQLPIVRALRGESTDNMEAFVRNEGNPEGLYLSVSGRPLRDASGQVRAAVAILHDITKRKRAEIRLEQTIQDLRNQTRLMQTVFDNMEEGVAMIDTAGNYLLTNQRREEMIGQRLIASEPAEWPTTFGAFHLDKKTHYATADLPIIRAMRGEVTEDMELFIRNESRPEGAYIRARGRPLVDGNQEVVAGVAIFSDITKYKQAEAELEQKLRDLENQTQLTETVFESISDGVVVADAAGQFTIFNSSAEDIVGMGMMASSPDQWTQHYGIFQIDGQTPVPTAELPLVRAMQGEAIDELEMFIRNEKRPDGVFISVNGRPLQKNAEGHGGGVITFRDVTSRKMAEAGLKQAMQELRDQNELLEATFNGINDGLVVVNTEGELLAVNPIGKQIAAFETLEPSQAQMVRRWGTYYYPDRETLIPAADLPLNRTIFHGETIRDTNMFVRTQTRPEGFFVRINVRPLLHAGGGIRGAVVIFRDITDEMQAEEALMQAFAQGRLEILDTILHNIGNAINSVTTGIDTLHLYLANDPLLPRFHALTDAIKAHRDDWADYVAHDPQGQKVMPSIIALGENLTRQHDEMTKAAKRVRDRAHHIADIVRTQRAIDHPHMVQKDLDLEQALAAALKVLHDSLANRGIKVEVQCRHAPQVIRVQESRFHQMIVNLIKNAMEAIDELADANRVEKAPCIRIRAYVDGEFLYLDVTDNGIGIDGTNLKILFAAGYTTKRSGSGLGLHSSANFVTGMGGQIHALSDGLGKGATLRVMLRLASITPPHKCELVSSGPFDGDGKG